MSTETRLLQYDLFSGELVDTRSDTQKKKDREHDTPHQTQMFTTPEMVQFGSQRHSAYRDWLSQATPPPLALEIQDVRTAEEMERDLKREAEKLTVPLFAVALSQTTDQNDPAESSSAVPTSGIIFDAQTHQKIIGLRAKLRARQMAGRVRRRIA